MDAAQYWLLGGAKSDHQMGPLAKSTSRDLTPANRITDEIYREVSPGT